jgi:hypothetical protein
MWQSAQKIREHFSRLRVGACAGLFIAEDQGYCYNAITALNYLLQL